MARRRRLARLRATALPILRLAVKPTRKLPALRAGSGVAANSRVKAPTTRRMPRAAARKSARFCRRHSVNWDGREGAAVTGSSGRKLLAAMGAAAGQDLAAAGGGHARTKAMAALAHDFARLIGALHKAAPGGFSAFLAGEAGF